jgi:hypothetical protein
MAGRGALHQQAHKAVAIAIIDTPIDINILMMLVVGLSKIVDDKLGLHSYLPRER